jgi:hypothetical protein
MPVRKMTQQETKEWLGNGIIMPGPKQTTTIDKDISETPTPDTSKISLEKDTKRRREVYVWRFYVVNDKTLWVADFRELTKRSEFYDYVYTFWRRSPEELAEAIDNCEPLRWEVHRIYSGMRDKVVKALFLVKNTKKPDKKRVAALNRRLDQLPQEPDEGMTDWLLSLTQTEFEESVTPPLEQWFADRPDWNYEEDYLPEGSTAQGAALEFFRNEDPETLDSLGIEIIEGDRPGSTYYAAELRTPIDEANKKAEQLKLPIWFERSPT